MSWLSEFLHPGNAYDKARQAEEQYYQEAQGYRQPYMEQGQKAGGTLQEMLNKLSNPQELQNEWIKGYETSPYAKQLQEQAQTGGLDAASAMGLGGSSAALSNIQKGSSDIMQKDRDNYLNNIMQKYLAGMGLGESLYGTGANMAGQAAQGAQSMGQDVAGLEYGKNASGRNMLMKILSMLPALLKSGDSGATPWQDPGSLPGWGG